MDRSIEEHFKANMTEEQPNAPVSQVRSRLRQLEDFTLASRLQEEEFVRHYTHNRTERRRMGTDVRRSLSEQALEDRSAAWRRAQQHNTIAEHDAALARRLQTQLEEEQRKREYQALCDARLAQRLQTEQRLGVEADEAFARRLQRQLNNSNSAARPNAVHRALDNRVLPSCSTPRQATTWCDRVDETTQNQLNMQMASERAAHASRCTAQRSDRPLASLAGREENLIDLSPPHSPTIHLHPTNPFISLVRATTINRTLPDRPQ